MIMSLWDPAQWGSASSPDWTNPRAASASQRQRETTSRTARLRKSAALQQGKSPMMLVWKPSSAQLLCDPDWRQLLDQLCQTRSTGFYKSVKVLWMRRAQVKILMILHVHLFLVKFRSIQNLFGAACSVCLGCAVNAACCSHNGFPFGFVYTW